jgi:predicted DNA-binding transcriptional regulator YafY
MYQWRESYTFTVTFAASAEVVAGRLPGWLGTPQPLDDGGCRLRATTGDPPEWVAARLALLGHAFTVHEPDELVWCVRELGERLVRAAEG